MNHTIESMPQLICYEDKHKVVKNGFAFMDEFGSCIIIVYGEGRRDDLKKYLSNDGDEFGIKYITFKIDGKNNG